MLPSSIFPIKGGEVNVERINTYMDMNFRKFIYNNDEQSYSEVEIVHMYFHGHKTVREISSETNKSMREIYRIIHSHGGPNRQRKDHEIVYSLADSGLGLKSISDFSGYTTRHVRNILKGRK